MLHSSLTRQRLVGVFALGLLLLFSPIVVLFDRAAELAGVPLSYVYLFGVWTLLVLLAAWITEGRGR